MERKIGEKFTIDGKTYIVVEEESNHVCEGCVCRNSHYTECLEFVRRFAGDCSMESRTDGKDVIFKEIKQNNTNMKPFNLEQAKAGKPVCTRDGLSVEILRFDVKNSIFTIVAIIKFKDGSEEIQTYTNEGYLTPTNEENNYDLMMVAEKKQGWIAIFNTNDDKIMASTTCIYKTEEMVKKLTEKVCEKDKFIIKRIEWEE